MTAQRWDGSSWQDISTAKRWDGSGWVDLTIAKRWDGNAWHDIAFAGGGVPGSLSAVTSGNATNIFYDPAPPFETVVMLTTPSVTVTASGGTPPYTYQWTRTSGDSRATCDSPTSSTTTWTANLYKNTSSVSAWRCRVTDDIGDTVDVYVPVELAYYTGVIP